MHRRRALQILATGAVGACMPRAFAQKLPATAGPLSAADEAFLDDMQRRACLFFVEQAGEKSGQVLDRAAARNNTGDRDGQRISSIAATGFGLTALCIADKRGYQPHAALLEQVKRTLKFHCDTLPHEHGFYYHFND